MEKQESWFNRHPILTTILIIFALLIIYSVIRSDNNESHTDKSANIEDVNQQDNTQSNSLATWHEIKRFEGSGIKDTDTFNIPLNEWRISWDTKPREDVYGTWPSNFAIYVYSDDGQLVDVVANVVGYSKDSTIMRGAGNYYLGINSGQPYIILIEAKY